MRSSEAVIELMYQAQLKPWWMLQPDLQYVINPGGGVLNSDGSLRRNALVVGVRSFFNFLNETGAAWRATAAPIGKERPSAASIT